MATTTTPMTETPPATDKPLRKKSKRKLIERLDAFISKLSTRSNFWHRVCSMIWLPYAARSGIYMKRLDPRTFTAVLPFKRFNRNWYNAMAGAALLGNTEIAGGMYVFGFCGADYTVVCKELQYKFLRPCFGPAVYRIDPKDDIEALVKAGGEFNIELIMNVTQKVRKPGDPEKRVGRAKITFHVTPKAHQRERGRLK
ncbi:MAG: hypothetical protein H6815_12155 [Phycisphaeraceae bacterium]|nr:hypothetical protein [Phycisphaerales bacterium]MCB9861193.1 hypothetical protein [Phycisphaeraceae bacterium]